MVAKLGNREDPLPQDSFEGVDEDEWVSAPGPACSASSTALLEILLHAFPPGPSNSRFLVSHPRTSLHSRHT